MLLFCMIDLFFTNLQTVYRLVIFVKEIMSPLLHLSLSWVYRLDENARVSGWNLSPLGCMASKQQWSVHHQLTLIYSCYPYAFYFIYQKLCKSLAINTISPGGLECQKCL